MGIGLRGAGGEVNMSHATWGAILMVAEEFEWEPWGTVRPMGEEDPSWSGTYLSNDWQTVTEEDAANIAAALERAQQTSPAYAGANYSDLPQHVQNFIPDVVQIAKSGAFIIT